MTDFADWYVIARPGASTALPKLTGDLVPRFPTTATSISVRMLGGTAPVDTYASFRHAYPLDGIGGVAPAAYRVNQTSTSTL